MLNLLLNVVASSSFRSASSSFLPGLGGSDSADPNSPLYEKAPPSPALQGSLLAITTAPPNANEAEIRDANVMGFLWVAENQEAKKKVRVLAPVSASVPVRAMVLGRWPEEVTDLVG